MKFEISTNYNRSEHATLFSLEKSALIYQSPRYYDFLKDLLGEASEAFYFFVYDSSGKNVGIFPGFIKHGKYGSVYNSLPFFGSNGGVLWSSSINEDDVRIGTELVLKKLTDDLAQSKFLATTVITSPLDRLQDIYARCFLNALHDYRIGQLSPLADLKKQIDQGATLESFFNYKTRNMVKKSQKVGVQIRKSGQLDDLHFLFETHVENMKRIGGTPKDFSVFEKLTRIFPLQTNSFLYVAELDGKRVGALFALGEGKIFEYFTPVIKDEFRDSQALSGIINFAMNDALSMGFDWWNWGGTWASQVGVHTFKKRWGTTDINYNYYTNVFDLSLFDVSRSELANEYKYFYVYPYGK